MSATQNRGQHHAIAIDGPAASGKSTVARQLAERLGLVMVNSGAMYRAVTWEVVRRGVNPADAAAVVAMLGELDVRCGVRDGHSTITIDGVDPDAELRSDAVNAAVSAVSAVPEVRQLLVAKQRELLEAGDLVMEGRDIGSVVFPDTPFKFYIDASEEVRRRRRAAEGQKDEVAKRDRQDSQRRTSPLRIAEGAMVIDSSNLDIGEVVERALEGLRDRGWFQGRTEGAP
jgi:cytidylate kinase